VISGWTDPATGAFVSVETYGGLSALEQTASAVIASGSIRAPCDRARPDGGPTPEQQYAREVLRVAHAVWNELERDDGS
jgi:hypothetical protein